MDIKKWFEDQNIEPVQDRKDMMDYWTNYELFTYNDLMECLEALFDVAHSSTQLKTDKKISFEEYLKQIDKHFIYDDFLKGEFTYTVGDLYREYTQAIK